MDGGDPKKGGLFGLSRPLKEVFPFFADAGNQERITPPWLRFEVLTDFPVSIQEGTIIDYRLRIHGIAVRWRSEITVWDPPLRFVDMQRRGPCRKWIHEHFFIDCVNGSEICDYVQYASPGRRLANLLFVQQDVSKIVGYRTEKLRDLFY